MADASHDLTTRQVPAANGRLHVSDHGDEPALVLMHGFPADSRICGRLAPLLSPRRAVAFDFIGYGGSDRYLSPDLAAHLAGLFAGADIRLVDGASHWPHWDQTEAVSELIR